MANVYMNGDFIIKRINVNADVERVRKIAKGSLRNYAQRENEQPLLPTTTLYLLARSLRIDMRLLDTDQKK
ncbi:hypothetical protein GFS03_04205 [Sulfolobus sp. E5-1-F]|uniref:hypothetical protein n=1 Tax=Saccharolobus sp. E5-1-F TaxID=2663019 RepID=UPI001297D502|nr:hypothetical protein [Sulfolobus sp. E5-1-F]QGA53839.1 hypothetical protein GFS03_04205 [Sulfolobus sp. E5-1-F]